MTVHSFARSKLPRQNMMNDVRLFSRVLSSGQCMRLDKRQSIQLCPPHLGLTINTVQSTIKHFTVMHIYNGTKLQATMAFVKRTMKRRGYHTSTFWLSNG